MQPAGLHEIIPGLKEAEDKYRTEQFEAFSGVESKIAGAIEVLPLTPKMFIDLDGANNAFLSSANPVTEGDICVFLWRCSPFYTHTAENAKEMRSLFNASLYVLPYESSVEDIFSYLRRSWSGMPLWKSKTNKAIPVAQWPAHLVHMFASEYGWLEEYTLNLPFRRLWQYANRIQEEKDPDYRERCREAMSIRENWLAERNKTTVPANGRS